MSTRRQFLGTLGKLLGAGGVLLPVAGKGALALPADLGKAAALPVVPTSLPVSPELLRLRKVREELHDIYLWNTSNDRGVAWRNVMRNKHEPLADAIIGRIDKNPTWQDCREIAEAALFHMHRQGPHDRSNPLCALVYAVLWASGETVLFVPEIGKYSLKGSEPL